ncbi:MAG TPA: redoxin domain-containing protein [Pirellulales bacterium]|jgi:peroxiredoxin/mono/diheme cytochrome c family protein
MLRSKIALLLCAAAVCCGTTVGAAERSRIGAKIADFSLKNQFGKEYSLADVKDADLVVVAFLGAECPLAKLYGPRLAELAAKYKDAKVAFLAIDSNRQDSIEEITAYALRHHIEFPFLRDAGNKVADQFGAERTPEVFVLDKNRVVRYHGRVDNQYGFTDGVGYQRPDVTRGDLAEAINELVAGKEISVPTTEVVGCKIGRVRQPTANATITYSKQIARVFQDHCVECHRPGRIGPFAMTSYEEVAGWGEMIREVVDLGRMPPWHADKKHGSFSNDLSLSDENKKLIAAWVDSGCPEGDPADLPKPREFADGWVIGEPDQVVYIGENPVDVPAEGVIEYYHFTVDPGWKEDKWLMAAEAKPSSLETVHHILVFVQPPGGGGFLGGLGGNRGAKTNDAKGDSGKGDSAKGRDGNPGAGPGLRGGRGGGIESGNMIAGYAPGMNPLLHTDGTTAMHVKAGSKLVFQLHYTPNGTPAKDRSYVGLKFTDPEKVKWVARSTSVANMLFAIPPGDSDYQVTAEGKFEHDTLVANMTPHMHTRGKSFRYEVTYPDGNQEILLDVPRYDFNWQTTYMLEKPKLLPKGTKLVCTAHWDNSEDNLSNPNPNKTVTWGSQTFEEMMIGFYVEVFPKGEMPARPSGGRSLEQFTPEKVLAALDANKDGKLTKEEVPGQVAQRFDYIDQNHDGELSKSELELLLNLFRAVGGRRE